MDEIDLVASKDGAYADLDDTQTPADTSNMYTERRRLAPEYIGSNTHTHQCTQLTIVTNIIEREFVATAILSLKHSRLNVNCM